jgi:transposase-like protein
VKQQNIELESLREMLKTEEMRYKIALANEAKNRKATPLASRIAKEIDRLKERIKALETPPQKPVQKTAKRPTRLKLNPEVSEAIRAMKRTGATHARIAKEFGISLGSVTNALSSYKNQHAKVEELVEAPQELKDPTEQDDIPDLIALLQRVVVILEDNVVRAAAGNDVDNVNKALRVLNPTVALLHKLTPEPTKNLDDRPDMIAAAARCKEKLHKLLDRAIERRSQK